MSSSSGRVRASGGQSTPNPGNDHEDETRSSNDDIVTTEEQNEGTRSASNQLDLLHYG